VSELIEQLRAQAVTLRQENSAPWHYGGRQDEISLADMIDGMLEMHPPCDCRACERQGAPTGCARCRDLYEACGTGTFYPCATLTLLASHVTAVLSGYTQTAREGR
jgi:hypothetical protein